MRGVEVADRVILGPAEHRFHMPKRDVQDAHAWKPVCEEKGMRGGHRILVPRDFLP